MIYFLLLAAALNPFNVCGPFIYGLQLYPPTLDENVQPDYFNAVASWGDTTETKVLPERVGDNVRFRYNVSDAPDGSNRIIYQPCNFTRATGEICGVKISLTFTRSPRTGCECQ